MTTAIILHPLFSEIGGNAHNSIYRHIAKAIEQYWQDLFLDMPPPKPFELKLMGTHAYFAELALAWYHDIPFIKRAINETEIMQNKQALTRRLSDYAVVFEEPLTTLTEALKEHGNSMSRLKHAIEKLAIPDEMLGPYLEDEAEHNKKRFQKEQQKLRVRYSQRRR